MFDRRLVKHFDWILLLLTALVVAVGLVNLYSATSNLNNHRIFYRQAIWVGIGFGALLASLLFNYHKLEKYAYHLYGAGILLLLAVLILGETISGSTRWIIVGPVSFQPSELSKLILIVALARLLFRRQLHEPLSFADTLLPLAFMAVPFILILKEPDLGTALLLVFITASMMVFIGIKTRVFLFLAGATLFFIPLVWNFLKEYQKERIIAFIYPENDPMGSGYHILQSKIAVGSGGFIGKGYMASTQSQLNFLPEHHTDFAFSVLAEEWGFIGASLVILLFLVILIRGLSVVRSSKNMFGSLVAVGVVSMFFWQTCINIGMVSGLLPVVGIPLPFISYGGSSVVSSMLALGLLMNISMRRFLFR
jgi:rod shape determining protein RodA